MPFSPMDIPPGSGPSLAGKPDKKWHQNPFLWTVAAGAVVGALVFGYLLR